MNGCEAFAKNPESNAQSVDTANSSPLIGSAAMDRLVHKGTELVIDGASYRATQFRKKVSLKEKN